MSAEKCDCGLEDFINCRKPTFEENCSAQLFFLWQPRWNSEQKTQINEPPKTVAEKNSSTINMKRKNSEEIF